MSVSTYEATLQELRKRYGLNSAEPPRTETAPPTTGTFDSTLADVYKRHGISPAMTTQIQGKQQANLHASTSRRAERVDTSALSPVAPAATQTPLTAAQGVSIMDDPGAGDDRFLQDAQARSASTLPRATAPTQAAATFDPTKRPFLQKATDALLPGGQFRPEGENEAIDLAERIAGGTVDAGSLTAQQLPWRHLANQPGTQQFARMAQTNPEAARSALLEYQRTQRDSLPQKAGMSFRAGAGGLVAGLGGAAKAAGATGVGGALAKAGAEAQRGAPMREKEFSAADLADPEWWATTAASTAGTAVPLAVIALVTGGTVAAAASAAGLGTMGATLVGAGVSGVASRLVEGAIEAGGTYEEALSRGMGEDEATRAARNVFLGNQALSAADAAQFLLTMAKIPESARKVATRALQSKFGRAGIGAARVLGTAALEGAEEGAQDVFQRQALGDEVAFDPRMQEAVVAGGIFGGGMGLAGGAFRGKEAQEPAQQTAPQAQQPKYRSTVRPEQITSTDPTHRQQVMAEAAPLFQDNPDVQAVLADKGARADLTNVGGMQREALERLAEQFPGTIGIEGDILVNRMEQLPSRRVQPTPEPEVDMPAASTAFGTRAFTKDIQAEQGDVLAQQRQGADQLRTVQSGPEMTDDQRIAAVRAALQPVRQQFAHIYEDTPEGRSAALQLGQTMQRPAQPQRDVNPPPTEQPVTSTGITKRPDAASPAAFNSVMARYNALRQVPAANRGDTAAWSQMVHDSLEDAVERGYITEEQRTGLVAAASEGEAFTPFKPAPVREPAQDPQESRTINPRVQAALDDVGRKLQVIRQMPTDNLDAHRALVEQTVAPLKGLVPEARIRGLVESAVPQGAQATQQAPAQPAAQTTAQPSGMDRNALYTALFPKGTDKGRAGFMEQNKDASDVEVLDLLAKSFKGKAAMLKTIREYRGGLTKPEPAKVEAPKAAETPVGQVAAAQQAEPQQSFQRMANVPPAARQPQAPPPQSPPRAAQPTTPLRGAEGLSQGEVDALLKGPTKPTVPQPTQSAPPRPGRSAVDEPQGTAAPRVEPLSTGATTTVRTERGTAVEVQYALVDASALTASHDVNLRANERFPQELQPRDRSRAASEDQINRIAGSLQPEFLGENPKASEGAPIVGPDMVVESGNGRVIALQRVYQQNKKGAESYRQWLTQNAAKFGLDPKAIEQAKAPVLVRVRQGEIDRARFASEANEQAVAAMSATEQAQADAKKLTGGLMGLFNPSETGDILTGGNREFISRFMDQVIGPAERGRYLTEGGGLSQEGIQRIRNAIFAKAYGDTETLAKLAESTDNNVKNITNAMVKAAPLLADVKEKTQNGDLHDLDATVDMAAAARKLSELRETGDAVNVYLNQITLLDDGLSPLAKEFLSLFNQHSKSYSRLANLLTAYAKGAEAVGSPKQANLLGVVPTQAEILHAAVERVARDAGQSKTDNQATFLQDAGMAGPQTTRPDGPGGQSRGATKQATGQGRATPPQAKNVASQPKAPAKATEAKPVAPMPFADLSPKQQEAVRDERDGSDASKDTHHYNEATGELIVVIPPHKSMSEGSPQTYLHVGPDGKRKALFFHQRPDLTKPEWRPVEMSKADAAAPKVAPTPPKVEASAPSAVDMDAVSDAFREAREKTVAKMKREEPKWSDQKINILVTEGMSYAMRNGTTKTMPKEALSGIYGLELRGTDANNAMVTLQDMHREFADLATKAHAVADAKERARADKPTQRNREAERGGVRVQQPPADPAASALDQGISWNDKRTPIKDAAKSLPQRIRKALDNIVDEAFDDMHALKRAQKRLAGKQELHPDQDAYLRMELLPKLVPGRTEAKLREWQKIMAPLGSKVKDYLRYADARSALFEAEQHGKSKFPFDLQAASDFVGRNDSPEFRKAFEAEQKLFSGMLGELKDAGMLNQEAIDRIETKYKDGSGALHYIPMFRDMKAGETNPAKVAQMEGSEGTPGQGRSAANVPKGVLSRGEEGSDRPLLDPVERRIRYFARAVGVAERNKAGRTLANFVASFDTDGTIMQKTRPPMEHVETRIENILQDIFDAGFDVDKGDPTQMVEFFRPKWAQGKNDTIITIWQDGKKTYYDVHDPAVLKAIVAMDPVTQNVVAKVFEGLASVYRTGATITPGFTIANVVRDTVESFVLSKHQKVPGHALFEAVKLIAKKDPFVQRVIDNGLKQGGWMRPERQSKQMLADIASPSGGVTPKALWNLYQGVRSNAEFVTRLGEASLEYKSRLKKGESEDAAFLRALREGGRITLNFTRGGRTAKEINRKVPFFKIPFEAAYRANEAIQEQPGLFLMKAILPATAAALATVWFNRDDDRYKEASDIERDRYTLVSLKDMGYPALLRVPKANGIYGAFQNLVERSLRQWMLDDTEAFNKWGKSVLGEVFPRAYPHVMELVVGLATGQRLDDERPIVPYVEQKLSPERQFDSKTSPTAKAAAQAVGASPRKVQYAIERLIPGYSDGFFRLERWWREEMDKTPAPQSRPEDTVGVGRFVSRPGDGKQGRSVDLFFQQSEKIDRIYNDLRDEIANRSGKTVTMNKLTASQKRIQAELLREMPAKDLELLKKRKAVNKHEQALTKLRQQRQQVEEHPNMSPEQKRRRLEEINRAMTDAARKALGQENMAQ